jgi:hypothetical protein
VHDDGDPLTFLDNAGSEMGEQDRLAGTSRGGVADLAHPLKKPGTDIDDASLLIRSEYHRRNRSLFAAEGIKIDIVSAAAESAGAGQRIALCVHPDRLVPLDELALDTIAFLAMPRSAHDRYSAISGDGIGQAPAALRIKVMHAPRPDRSRALLAASPAPISTMPLPGSLPIEPSARMNLVLPFGKQSTWALGTTRS